jgi:hypothetical protein
MQADGTQWVRLPGRGGDSQIATLTRVARPAAQLLCEENEGGTAPCKEIREAPRGMEEFSASEEECTKHT